jgi:hypothetical protein
MSGPPFLLIPAQLHRLYSQEITREAMGLLMGAIDVLEAAQGPEDQTDYADMRCGLSEIEYDPDEDVFLLVGTREEYLSLCGFLMDAYGVSPSDRFHELASLLVAVLDEADSNLAEIARWN